MTNVIKRVREARGILSSEAAKELNLTPTQYSRKEKGIIDFNLEQIMALSKLLNVKIDDLLFSDDVIIEFKFVRTSEDGANREIIESSSAISKQAV